MENPLSSTQQVRAHVFVSGTVHRVGFRLAAWDKANQWGIGGWVEEIPDKRVEIVFEGSKELVEAVVRWCYRGSPDAVVKSVKVEYEEPEGLKEFIIRRSDIRGSQSVSGRAKTLNILIFFGVSLKENESLPYDILWEKVQKDRNLADRIDNVIRVSFGQNFEENEEKQDAKIYLAQKFIAAQLDPERLRQNPSGKERDMQPWWRSLVQPLRQTLLLQGLGDLVYYAAQEGQIAIQLAVYSQVLEILEKYRGTVEKDLGKEAQTIKVRLHLIGWGLGGAIAYDFLHGLFSPKTDIASEPAEKQETLERYQFWRRAALGRRLEVGSMVSIASPLPVLMLRTERVIDTFALGETLLTDEIGIPNNAKEIIWKNFYNLDDLQAFPIRPLFGENAGIQDIEVDAIWSNEEIHKHVAELLNRRVVS